MTKSVKGARKSEFDNIISNDGRIEVRAFIKLGFEPI